MKSVRLYAGADSTRWAVRLLAVLAGLCVFAAASAVFNLSPPAFKGRMAWAAELVFSAFGEWGLAALWLLLAAALSLTARLVWRHTPKLPSDRWFL